MGAGGVAAIETEDVFLVLFGGFMKDAWSKELLRQERENPGSALLLLHDCK